MTPTDALRALTDAGLKPVLDAALLRYKRTGTLGRSRPDLSPGAWTALSRLTGQKSSGTLDLAELDAALRRSRYGVGLLDVLTALNGAAIVVQRQQRETQASAWEDLLGRVPNAAWRVALRAGEAGAALLKQAQRQGADVAGAVRVVSAALDYITNEPTTYAVLAAQLTGNAHALDADTLTGRVLRAAISALNLPAPERDGVSSAALCANLRGPAWLNAAAGHCLALPLREVLRLDTLHVPADHVWVVENPSVFEALHAAHPTAPLICTSGQPVSAVQELLKHLPKHTTAFLSCDLDVGGLRIAAYLLRTVPLNWQPWRMDATAYALACSRGSLPLSGDVEGFFSTFPELAQAMRDKGRGAHQENLLPELLADVAEVAALSG